MKPSRSAFFVLAATALIVCILTQPVLAASFSFGVGGSGDRFSIDFEGTGTITHMNAGPPTQFKIPPTSLLDLNIMRASDLRVTTGGSLSGSLSIGTRAPIVSTLINYSLPSAGLSFEPFVRVANGPFGEAIFALDAAASANLQALIDQFGPDKLFLSLQFGTSLFGFGAATVSIFSAVREISIDIKPGNDDNSINPRSRGKIAIAILTTATFDANTVDIDSVRFGATGSEATAEHSAFDDIDGDGDLDLVLHFRTQETNIGCGTDVALL